MMIYKNISRIEIVTRADNGLLVYYYTNVRDNSKHLIGIITCRVWAEISHILEEIQEVGHGKCYTVEPIGCTCVFFPKVERFWHKVNSLEEVGEIFKC